MKAYIFRGQGNYTALSTDKEGANLPDEGGPYSYWKEIDLDPAQNRIGLDTAQAIEALKGDGFMLQKAEIIITESGG